MSCHLSRFLNTVRKVQMDWGAATLRRTQRPPQDGPSSGARLTHRQPLGAGSAGLASFIQRGCAHSHSQSGCQNPSP